MQYINLDTWKRREHFRFFYRMDFPHYNVCANIDVTNLRRFVKKQGISFYYAMVYAVTHAANQIENFRYRIRDEGVILHEKLHASFTDMDEDEDDLFRFVTVEMTGTLLEFVKRTAEYSRQKREYLEPELSDARDDLILMTCLPWVSFTSISHPFSFKKNDSAPRISWGKYFVQGDKLLMPFSVHVNHALVDGVHVGRYFTVLQQYLDNLGIENRKKVPEKDERPIYDAAGSSDN